MTFNIIADIAGRYDELMKLIDLMPKADRIILVGDLVDRGPKSRQVVEWAMNTPNVITLLGNHEDMMVESYHGGEIDHVRNGGLATMKSFDVQSPSDYSRDVIGWMESLPLSFTHVDQDYPETLFISHAPWPHIDLGETWGMKHNCIWNRYPPKKVDGTFQVFGHNHIMQKYDDYAICIDDCGKKVLTGLSYPGKKIYQVPYYDD